MRIISGKYGGHHLVSFKADHIRPTTDRVKETLFNKWMGELENAKCLDLFSGTGSLGLEALSRGAAHCTFVDSHRQSIGILKQNLEKLKVPKSEYSIFPIDVLQFLQKTKDSFFDFIFVDPPFTKKIADEVMMALAKSTLFGSETLICIESIKQEKMEDVYGPLLRYDKKDYGDKILSFFRNAQSLSSPVNFGPQQ